MVNPFLIHGPGVISFSGGRSSGRMLYEIVQAHGGALPDDVVVCFANTGREMDCTLDFVHQCAAAWNVRIHWLEYRHEPGRSYFEEVSHNSAARAGEPFDALLSARKIVPDPFRRFCTSALKIVVIKQYLRSLGWKRWTNVVGLRADETARLETRRKEEASPKWRQPYYSAFPLAAAGIDVGDVMKFWRQQPFDLRLDADGDGGQCDGCFMFSSAKLGRMFQKYPERMAWWPDKERERGSKTMVVGRSYAEIRRVALAQSELPWDDAQPCEKGCGL